MTFIGMGLGAAWGALLAYLRKGKPLDMLHYAAVLAIVGGLIGMIAGIVIARMG